MTATSNPTLHNKSLTEQAAVLFIGNIVALVFGASIPIVLVRVFPRHEYGIYQQLFLIFITLLPIGQMGVTQGLYYFLPRDPERKDAVVSQTFVFVLGAGAVCLFVLVKFRAWIAATMNSPAIEQFLPLMAVYVFLMITSSFLETLMIAEGKAHLAAAIRVLSELARSIAVIGAAMITASISVILLSLIFFSILRCAFQGFYLRRRYNLSPKRIDFSFWRLQLGYSIPIGFSNVAWLLQMKLHSYFVSFLFAPATFAIYTVGTYDLPFQGLITTAVSNVIVPALSKAQKEGSRSRIIDIWNGAMRKLNLIFFPMCVFFLLMAPEFIAIVFTSAYAESVPIFRISLLGLILSGINTGAVLNAYAQTQFQMNLALIRLPVAIVVLYFFTKAWGLVGAVTANLSTLLLFMFFSLARIRRLLDMPWADLLRFKENARIMATALLGCVPVAALKQTVDLPPLYLMAVALPVFFVSYLIFGIAIGITSRAEVTALLRVITLRLRTATGTL